MPQYFPHQLVILIEINYITLLSEKNESVSKKCVSVSTSITEEQLDELTRTLNSTCAVF